MGLGVSPAAGLTDFAITDESGVAVLRLEEGVLDTDGFTRAFGVLYGFAGDFVTIAFTGVTCLVVDDVMSSSSSS